jgi:3-oxoacyl-[acyl-carrier-protein] synthase II
MIAGHVSMRFGFKGPNLAVVTACTTGLHCIGEASRMIEYGDADVVVAGGSEATISPLGLGGFAAMRALSTRNDDPAAASRPWDKDRDGFVLGEGAGVMVVEEYEHAKARGANIIAEIVGYGATGDAYHLTAPDESGVPGSRAVKNCLAEGQINPEDVSYINAPGTSTSMNDKIETQVVKLALGEAAARKTMMSSTKSMTGHLLGGAGAIECAVIALAVKNDVIPPTINYEDPDPDCDLDYVPNTARKITVKYAISNSLGFGGHNVCVALKKFT